MNKRRVCLIVSSELTVKAFLLSHLNALSTKYDVSLIVHTKDENFLKDEAPEVKVISVVIERMISPMNDIRAMARLIGLFRKEGFYVVHSVTSKVGLLAMMAARLTGVPIRVHTFTGQMWVTSSGYKRWFLRMADRVVAACATDVLADSPSQLNFLIKEEVVKDRQAKVLADGSISGADTKKFSPDLHQREMTRKQLDIPSDAMLFLFLGRINKEKGVLDLLEAFSHVSTQFHDSHLLFVGPDEQELKQQMLQSFKDHNHLHFVEYTNTPEQYMQSADVFCLPSYREGFGTVVIEAAACGVPAIGSRIYGVTDAIEHKRSGLLYPVGDVQGLAEAMMWMLRNRGQRLSMGEYARFRVESRFSQGRLTSALLQFYKKIC